jgi:hypothetical protein
VCRTGPLTSPATRWWRRWTRSASTARSSSPHFPYRYNASYAVEVQQAHPDRFAIVKPVDPEDPAVRITALR